VTVRPYSTREDRQARRTVPQRITGGLGEGADFELGEGGVGERRKNRMLLRGALAGR